MRGLLRGPREGPAFYCVSSGEYFLGAVAMINSLRLHGHREPVYVTDLGLEPWQRDLLAGEATVRPSLEPSAPWLAKTAAPLAEPHETSILIDVDMVVTRPLGELIEAASGGRPVVFENEIDRWSEAWGPALGLGPLERRRYLNSGFFACAGERGRELLELLDRLGRKAEVERSYFGADEAGYPLRFLDQDILNAALSASYRAPEVESLPAAHAPTPPYAGLRVSDERRGRCAYEDGIEPWVVHQLLSPKPWEAPIYDGVYSLLLRRLLGGDGIAIKVPADRIPLRLRLGRLAAAERRRVNVSEQVRWRLGGRDSRSRR